MRRITLILLQAMHILKKSLHLHTSHQTEAETHVPGIYATVTKGGKE
jgi:hypothetical protein